MTKKVKVSAADQGWNPISEYLIRLLGKRYEVEISFNKPDLFFSNGRCESSVPKDRDLAGVGCLRVFTSTENVKPNFSLYDYAFTFGDTDDRNFQFPNFVRQHEFQQLRTQQYIDEVREYRTFPKTEFCNFIYSNQPKNSGNCFRDRRIAFAQRLMSYQYKRLDCPGESLNNMPSINIEGVAFKWTKLEFIKRHKFTIAFENHCSPHYVTEKIYHPLLVNSIPIYWGSPKIAEYFNPEALINCHDYDSFDHVIDRIIEVDNDDDLYRKYVDAPPVLEGSRLHALSEERIMERLDKIVDSIGAVKPVYTLREYQRRRAVAAIKAVLHPYKYRFANLLVPNK